MTDFPLTGRDAAVAFQLDANKLTDDDIQELIELLGGDEDAVYSILDDYR